VVSLLLTLAFLASATIAMSHVANRGFVAPVYDCALNLLAFSCQVTVAILLSSWPALIVSLVGIGCWLALTRRTVKSFLADRS
jgi:hypothetical protein